MKTIPVSRSAASITATGASICDAKRLEDVRASALRREQTIAVLRHAHANASDESAAAVEMLNVLIDPPLLSVRSNLFGIPLRRKNDHRLSARADHRRELERSLTLAAESHDQRGDLHRRCIAGEHHVKRRRQLGRIRCFTSGEPFDRSEKRIGWATGH
jgi:hypothetical protein